MPSSLFQYEMLPTTWFYMSSMIIFAVFFKFNRFWCVRNLDLLGLLLLTPGLLFLAMNASRWGYLWLFACGFLFITRLFLDLLMVRRPLLDPNLNPAGMALSVILLLLFMAANISVNRGATIDSVRTLRLEQILTLNDWEYAQKPLQYRVAGFRPFLALTDKTNQVMAPDRGFLPVYAREKADIIGRHRDQKNSFLNETRGAEALVRDVLESVMGPSTSVDGTTLAEDQAPDDSLVVPVAFVQQQETANPTEPRQVQTLDGQGSAGVSPSLLHETPPGLLKADDAKGEFSLWFEMLVIALVMLGHIAIVIGLIHIGHCHYNNLVTGISAAMLYLLLPYVNQMPGRLDHVIPGALILWAVALYRRPLFSGVCIGAAAALMFHPVFLVPLWCSYYWKRGLFRFLIGVVGIILVFHLLLLVSPLGSYGEQWLNMIGANNLKLHAPDGLWVDFPSIYRIPIMVVFVILCVGVIFWPSRKHLATLMCCSTIILLGLQFWQAHQGGLYMAWYLPLLITTLFRPNLEDRIASASVMP
ncbi:MAG: hypothetical protein FWD31_14080 [Planctomycetaceae bacterium]|nr:hypothetical protein [Planctomycetaceae bacterium]